jgi:transposase InsO family protein
MEIKVEGNIEPKGVDKKRFSAQEKLLILSEIKKEKPIEDVAADYSLAVGTLKRWQKKQLESKSKDDPLGLGGLGDTSTKPKKAGNKLSADKEKKILDIWKEHPGLGPSQIQYQLKRNDGIRVSSRAIRRVLIENGYERKKKAGTGELQRFEAERPNKLWQMDILDFWINKQRVYVMLMLDDFSRFVVGFGMFTEATMSHAITVLRKAVARYGRPESLLTDRGMQFYSWRTMSRFQKLLESLDVEHILARPHHPQTCGKVEALNKRLQNELIQKNHFKNLRDLEEAIAKWIYDYNHKRTHQGIKDPELGCVLVPADRYYGRAEEVLTRVRAKLAGKENVSEYDYLHELETLKTFEIIRILEIGDKINIWFCGKQYQLTACV